MNDQLLCLRGQLLKALMTALHGELITEGSRYFGSLYVSGKLPTYPSPKPTLKLTSHLGQIIDLKLIMIRYFLVLIIPTHWKFQFWLVITLVKMFSVMTLSSLDFQMSLHRIGEDIFSNHTETL